VLTLGFGIGIASAGRIDALARRMPRPTAAERKIELCMNISFPVPIRTNT